MSTLRNYVTNPGGEAQPLGWYTGTQIEGTLAADSTFTARMEGARGKWQIRWTSAGKAVPAGTNLGIVAAGTAPVKPGQLVRAGVRVWMDEGAATTVGFTFYDADMRAFSYPASAPESHAFYTGGDLTHLVTAPERAAFVRLGIGFRPTEAWSEGDKKRLWMDNAYLYVGDTAEDVPATYIDGTMPTTGLYSYGWDGTPHASTSYRMHTIDLVHAWTRRWWETLPNAYKEADAATNPELGGFPMLRWMNGIGQLAGEMRQISDDLWNGKYTDPATVPDSALRWLAMMLGLSAQHRQQGQAVLRERLTTLTNVGRSAAGTRAMIAESAKAYLLPGAQARVEPSSKRPHVLIMYVRAYEVPDDDLAGLARKVNAAGFVPAGHIVECQRVVTTWDAWEGAAGETWADKEKNIRTWNESDSAGVVLE